jgi:hypothetical protein
VARQGRQAKQSALDPSDLLPLINKAWETHVTPARIVAAFVATGLVIGNSAANTQAREDAQAIVLNAAPDSKNLLRINKKRERKEDNDNLPTKKLLFSPDPAIATRDFLRHLCITPQGSLELEVDKPDKKIKVVEGKIATTAEWINERAKQREEKEEKEDKKEEKKVITIDHRRTFWRENIDELQHQVDWTFRQAIPQCEDIKQKANMLIQQTLAAISAYTPSYLQTLPNAAIKDQVNITREKIKGYLAASNYYSNI